MCEGLDSDEIEIEYEDSDPHDAGSRMSRNLFTQYLYSIVYSI